MLGLTFTFLLLRGTFLEQKVRREGMGVEGRDEGRGKIKEQRVQSKNPLFKGLL